MKKKILIMLLFLFSVTFTSTASAGYNYNSKDGKASLKEGTKDAYLRQGDYGVRFTVVDKKTGESVSKTIDYYKMKDYKDGEVWHTRNNKLEYCYLKTANLDFKKKYKSHSVYKPELWNVISTGGKAKTPAGTVKKKYLSSKKFLGLLAGDLGVSLETIQNPKNALIFEPILYFHFNGKYYGMTATEIGFYETTHKTNAIYMGFRDFTHKKIPLAAYFNKTKKDGSYYFNIAPYKGRARYFSNKELVYQMGVGMYTGKPKKKIKPPKIKTTDYIYRPDTDVYTSVEVTAKEEANPEFPISVDFDIPGVGILNSGDFYIPKGYKQLIWVKWHTPKKAQKMEITATAKHEKFAVKKTLTVEITKKMYWEPANPTADDKKPFERADFELGYSPENSDIIKIKNADIETEKEWTRWTDKDVHLYAEPYEKPFYVFGPHKWKQIRFGLGFIYELCQNTHD